MRYKNRKATAIPLKGLYQLPFRFLAKGKEAKPDAKINKQSENNWFFLLLQSETEYFVYETKFKQKQIKLNKKQKKIKKINEI